MMVFLGLNGRDLEVQQPEVVTLMLSLASGRLSERELAEWLEGRLRRRR